MTLIQELKEFKFLLTKYNQVSFSEFWQNHSPFLPILTNFIMEFSIMAGTSVPSESSFSIAGMIQNKQRSAMHPETLEICMILKNHNKVMEQLDSM